ncbi:hypothetical protein SLS54_008956 [Diplodia seriata]
MASAPDPTTNALPASTSPFDQALAKFKGELSDKEIDDFQLTTGDDLKHAVLQLQTKQASEKRMQNLNRLTAFVEAMEQFDKVIQVFLNACDYIGFVWGPAKFMLVVAASHADALNTLLEAYQEIGEHMPLLPQYESLIMSGPYLHQVMGFLYMDILEFHRKAMKHFRQRGPLSTSKIKAVEANWQQIEDEETERRRRAIARWLAVEATIVDHEDALAVVEGNPNSGFWLFQQDLVKNWLDPHSIILQLSYQQPALQAFILDRMSSEGASDKLKSAKTAKEILNVALASLDGLFLVVDGIDECMFLYAKLVMEHLLFQVSKAGLKKEIGKIPPTVNEIYQRIIHRIFNESKLPDQQVAKTLLSWLLCAKRPLRWHEIQGAMCLDLDESSFDPDRRLVRGLKHFCGSLVEVRHGGTISFVHLTAQLQLEQLNMTRICFSHLALESHNPGITKESIREYVRRGEYAFTEYSIVHAFDHLHDTCSQLNADGGFGYQDLCATLHGFTIKCVNAPAKRANGVKSTDKSLAVFKNEPFFQDLRHAAAHVKRFLEKSNDAHDDNEPALTFNTQLAQVRNVMENMAKLSGIDDDLESLYGRDVFKCSESHCQSFYMGFSTEKARDIHCQNHERIWLCTFSGCHSSISGFSSAADIEKHKQTVHQEPCDGSDFPWNGTLASLNIEEEIKNGNYSAFDLWISQWEGEVSLKEAKSWFGNAYRRGLLDIARQSGQHRMLEKMLDKIDWTSTSGGEVKTFLTRTLSCRDEYTATRILEHYKTFITDAHIYSLVSTSLTHNLEAMAWELLSYPTCALSDCTKKNRHSSYLSMMIRLGHQAGLEKLFKDYKVDLMIQDEKGRFPTATAVQYDQRDMATYLVETPECSPSEKSKNRDTLLTTAGRQGQEGFILSLFREEQQDPNVRLWLRTAQFRNAVYHGDVQKTTELLDEGLLHVDELDLQHHTPWLWAVKKGYKRLVKIFLNRVETSSISFLRLYPGRDNNGVVHQAAFHGYDSILKGLLQSSKFDSELNRQRYVFRYYGTPLEIAKQRNRDGVVQIIEEYVNSLEERKRKQPPDTQSPPSQASTPVEKAAKLVILRRTPRTQILERMKADQIRRKRRILHETGVLGSVRVGNCSGY